MSIQESELQYIVRYRDNDNEQWRVWSVGGDQDDALNTAKNLREHKGSVQVCSQTTTIIPILLNREC